MEVVNALGRRKNAIARVYLQKGKGKVTINDRDLKEYFNSEVLVNTVLKPMQLTETEKSFDVKVNVNGGGISGQAGAISLGISRALVELNEDHKPALKAEGLMTRDPRMVERKKPGQKKARKKFQFSKR
jgi:small subunit ribosomal protein S9